MNINDVIKHGDIDAAIVEGKVCMGFKPSQELIDKGMKWDYYFGDTVEECVAKVGAALLHFSVAL